MRLKPRNIMPPPEEQQCLLRNNQIVNRHYDDNVSWTTNVRPVIALSNNTTRGGPQLWTDQQIFDTDLQFSTPKGKRDSGDTTNQNKTPGRDSALASPEFRDRAMVGCSPDGIGEDNSLSDLEYNESSPLLGRRRRVSEAGCGCSSEEEEEEEEEEEGREVDNYRRSEPKDYHRGTEEECEDEESEDSLFSDSSYDMSDSKDAHGSSPDNTDNTDNAVERNRDVSIRKNNINANDPPPNNKITTVLTNHNSLNRNIFRGTSRVDKIFTETVQPYFSVSSKPAAPPRISLKSGARSSSSSPPHVLDKLKLTLDVASPAAKVAPAPESPMSDSSSASSDVDVNVSTVLSLNNVSMAGSKEHELLCFLREEDAEANIVFSDDSKILNTQDTGGAYRRETVPDTVENNIIIKDLYPKCQPDSNNAVSNPEEIMGNPDGELNDNFLMAETFPEMVGFDDDKLDEEERPLFPVVPAVPAVPADEKKFDSSPKSKMNEINHYEDRQWAKSRVTDGESKAEDIARFHDAITSCGDDGGKEATRVPPAVRVITSTDKPKESLVERHSVGVSTSGNSVAEVSVQISANKETSDVALSPVEALNCKFDDELPSRRSSASMARRRPPKNSGVRFGRKTLNGDFDVYNIETAMPTIDWAAMEEHLTRAAKENDWLRRNDREEIRRKLAMDSDSEEYYCGERVTRKPSLTTRLQSGMNLQICFMNETASDLDSQGSDQDSENGNHTPKHGSPSDKRISTVLDPQKSFFPDYKRQSGQSVPNYTTKSHQPDQKTCNSFFGNESPPKQPEQMTKRQRPSFFFSRQKSWRLGQLRLSQKKEDPPNNKVETREDFLTRHARLQAEARHALSQAKEMARMQMEIERQRKKSSKKSPIADIVGISFPDGRHRLSRQLLTDMNVAQLQVIVNDLHSQIESLNEDLVRLLLERDDLNMEQDSMLVDIEDMTRFLGAKEEALKSHLVQKSGMK